ncbi:hypothetical protein [Roseomonas chloroacetimidivorans]|uniref:hypothetical protein n=1 Tax=Roseomonas chloroacetimidivorans TaxID=1766656 RepID=UPI003C707293
MRIGRMMMMLMLAALIAVPVAYSQLYPVLNGAEHLLTSFAPEGTALETVQVAAVAD